jgi:thioredoxin-related protein
MRSNFISLVIALFFITAIGLRADEARSAKEILTEAKSKAAAEQKAIFVHFSASWCGWCKRLEAFIDSKQIKPIFDKHFIDVKLVVHEREDKKDLENPGAEAVLKELGGPAGLPYHAFLDEKGNLIVNARRTPIGNNIGHPVREDEIAWFLEMVEKAAPKITRAELKAMKDWLEHQKK